MSEKTRKNKSPFSLGVRKRTFPWLVPMASVRLTLVLLSLSMILIFVATLEQVRIGIRGAQAEYFESFFGIWHYPVEFWGGSILNFLPLPIPGGYLLGGLLIVNLIAAFVTRFQMTLKKMGIQIIHLGIILLLIGQMVTQAIQVESRMQIDKGEKSNYIERFHGVELVFTDVTEKDNHQVVAIPEEMLETGQIIRTPDFPLKVKVKHFGPNCNFDFKENPDERGKITSGVNRGVGASANLSILPSDEDFSSDAVNFSYVVFELLDGSEELGTWAAISHPAGNGRWDMVHPKLANLSFQPIRHNGRLWGTELRSKREYLPYSIGLNKIENEFYQGTDIPHNFESYVTLNLENGQKRNALVYMNTPLRHDGKTFYQYQMNNAADYTVFQVIRNPSWLIPYIACILVSIGLLWQFSFHLISFLRKHSSSSVAA